MMADPVQSNGRLEDNTRAFQEKQWVRKVREEGDRIAFEKIFRSYYKRLYGSAYGYVKDSQDAEDIVQEVFLNIWSQKESWDPAGTVKQYLFAAVRNRALNILRHNRIRADAQEDVNLFFEEINHQSNADENPEVEELRKAIQNGIDQLPPRCRQIFVLSRRSGLTYSEIAEVLDISINTVGTQMGRALKYLRNHLVEFLPLLLAALLLKIFF